MLNLWTLRALDASVGIFTLENRGCDGRACRTGAVCALVYFSRLIARMSQPIEQFPPKDPALADLPPVEAPSAGFIVQLFVIPAVVVVVVIGVWLLFGKLAGGERDAMSYVETLKSTNANWRSAYELASLIQNDPKLARDPKLLGALTELLGARSGPRTITLKLTMYLALDARALFKTLDADLSGGGKADPLATLAQALDAKQPGEVRVAAAVSLAKQGARLDEKSEDPRHPRAHRHEPLTATRPFARWPSTRSGFSGARTTPPRSVTA